MKNRIVSIFLSLCLLTSVLSVGIIQTAAADAGTATVEQLAQETVQGSAILHCFNWSYNSIKANLPDIAAAGYTAVQTSPVQPPKDYNAGWTDVSGQWWKMYQPLDLRLADGGTWLGTKAELKSMCDEADKYGVKVIVDVVANHLANNGTNGGTFSNLNSGAANDMKNANYYHSDSSWANDDNRYNITQRHIGMPDLNTSNSYVQQKVIAMLKDCVDCGVDGFRFDAAKHIEVPNDNSAYASRFWQNVIGSINSYQSGLYIYGEILGGAGIDISNYTQYMDVTDDYTGTLARQAVRSQNSNSLHSNYYQKGVSADQAVLWAESHDTYMNSDGDSKNDSNDTIVKTWAIMGSRADSTALFFARPGNSAMGAAAGDTTWKSAAVAEVNKFKNAFDGTGEYLDYNGNTAYNVRGGKGAVISKLDGAGSVSLDAHGMPDGSYTDRVTGNSFTVSNGTLSGTVGSTGVAVVYNPQDVAREYITADALYLDPADISWQAADARYTMYLFSGSKSEWVDMTAADVEGFYTAEVPEGRWTGVIFCRMKGNTTENVWDNVMYQTADLFPADENDCFTINGNKEGNNYLGDWSVFAPHDHTYGGTPVWQWASDYSTATAVFACTVCGRTQSVAATVTSDVQEDVTVYTATASFNEQTYTDTQIAENASAKDMLYLLPSSNWKQDGARFAAYFFGNNGDAWASMTPTCDGNHYQVEIPEGSWTKVIFCRMNGNTTDNNWNDNVKWNQTDDLSYTVGQCYAVKEGTWDKGGGTWSDYTPEHDYQAAWTWNGTASATAVLTCKNGDSTKTLPATVTSSVTTEPTCNTAGERTYTATVNYENKTYTDTKTEEIAATGEHTYGEPAWRWAADYSSATAAFTCSVCQTKTSRADDSIDVTAEGDLEKHTAKVTMNETEYTDSKTFFTAGKLYLVTNENWETYNARFAMYVFNDHDQYAWQNLTGIGHHTYTADVPDGDWMGVIFVRMNPDSAENSWDQDVAWNQTADLVPRDGKYCYTVDGWDGGSWGVYQQPVHTYGTPVWTWNGYDSASAAFACAECDDVQNIPADISSATTKEMICGQQDGEITYTASVSFNGATYTDTKTDTIPANATHRYVDEWTWANDYSAATLTLSCEDCAFSEVIQVSGDAVKTDNTLPGRVAHTAKAEYNGSTFTDTQYESLAAPVIVYKSISLHDEIGMNFYVNLPESGNAENTDVTYTWNGETVEGALKPSSKYPGLYRTDFSLPARAMTDQVTVSVSFGSLTAEETYRVVDYAQSAAETYADNASLRLLLCNMLDYGAAAQIQFGYHTDDLASDYIAAVDSGWSRADAPAALNDSTDIAEVSSAFGIEYVGATMTTTSKTAVRLFFKVTDEQVFADTTASLNNVELTFKQHPGYEELRYLEISDLAAGEIFQNNTIVFGNNANNESRIYSAANYYNAVIEGDYADSFKTVMQTMYNYYDSARALEV